MKYYRIAKRASYIFVNNPFFLFKRLILEIKAFLTPLPKSPVLKDVGGVLLELDFNYNAKMKEMYFGTYQPLIAKILKKYLRKGDTFIDVGANIGYFSAVAAACVGKTGQVHSFEPVPEYFKRLENFTKKNDKYNITVNQFALGEEEKLEKIYIGGQSCIGNNTFFPETLEGVKGITNTEVLVRRLDKYIKEKSIENIKLIKIDVECFEFPVLKGLKDYFLECQKKRLYPLIVCEICPNICVRLGYNLQDLFDYMASFSFYPFDVINTKKRIDIGKIIENGQEVDVLFKNI